MYRSLYILIIVSLFHFSVKAQGETNIWYFGYNAGLDFGSGTPELLLDGALHTDEGCATISDPDGNLLFYTDGVTVYNRIHEVMPNGNDLHGSFSSTHSAIAVPKPNDFGKYYLFTVDVVGSDGVTTKGLKYSIVDMALNSGFGDVTSAKNIPMEPMVKEKVIAVLNANETGYWVVSHRHNSDEFIAFEITAGGVSTSPTVSAAGFNMGYFGNSGQIKISPDGSRLAVAGGGEVQIFDFDNETGLINNQMTLDNSVNSYGVEFSPNGNLLYIGFYGGVYQFDLQSNNESDIIASKITLSNISNIGYASLQLGPDGKIYVAKTLQYHLDIIHNPNTQGVGCDYEEEGIFLQDRKCMLGLPTFIQSFFNVSFQANNSCVDEQIQFSMNNSQTFDSLIWDFGDGTTSTEENPTHTYETAGDYDVSLSVTSGADNSVDTKTISVYEIPAVAPIVELRQCDDDLDGFSSFNLEEANAEISVNHLNEIITYYESALDAVNASDPIQNSSVYPNDIVSADTIWARVENTNGCYAISQIDLMVSTTQIPNTFTMDFYQCDDGADVTDGIATFDFSSVNTEIQALFPTGQQLTINYHRNQEDALAEMNPIDDISNYQNIGYPSLQDIFVRVENADNNDCLGLGHHITLHVESIPIANTVEALKLCDDDGNGTQAFDTSNIEATLLSGQTDVIISYTDETGNALTSPLPNPFVTHSQIITAKVTNTTSKDPDGACFDETQISFILDAAAMANPVSNFTACDTDNDGQFAFDTSGIEISVLNGQTGMLVSYSDENGNTLPSPLQNPFLTTSQTITVRIQNALSTFCYDETSINFRVSEQPEAGIIMDDLVCDDASNDGVHTFTLSNYDAQILNGQDPDVFSILYFDDSSNANANINALPDNYVVDTTSKTIYARIQNNSNTDCFDITSFELGVHYLPLANAPEPVQVCDDQSNDGMETINLNEQNTAILNSQSTSDNVISYHLSLNDAEANANALNTDFMNTENPQTIYARLENALFPDCFTTSSFQIEVMEQPVLLMDDQWPICEGSTVELVADAGYDEYLWSTGETTPSITVDTEGTYDLTVTNVYRDLRCETSKTLTVVKSNIATITEVETSDWSQDNNAVIIFVDGNGDYEFSLNGFDYQDSNAFNNLDIDDYTVYVRDKNGCGIVSEEIYLLYYPKFFTPNNDGYHDFWQLINSEKEPQNRTFIYDRYGKLIKQLRPDGLGWDGTFNGRPLPNSDYWFTLERENGKSYSGHFSLKR
ncbi:T9SS type B sorting domain-containing protein [Subsaximicrobium wynnwilliamsii]|uniref:T9SS type B sorting domain-containing protein n=1 Tax=Subsaximicrobium wynnwilliamsii TaxID=291179 RepID=A0A5C6ZIK9_9FLAO|nr:T9SS type B sorting domain-containing protein [Subsaximicrobium wynnwilliamsii]TXD83314.1 T9SS type B sorting domain-containing protein [Subsaximicrobium wynnwilliamsii]TXD89151.1 T9SS type B sorting domain-containing protein [Subsaximicrobium wynnwilliamsii]TXE03337.1 T9SS type B sorting domain-containing protein [Subsaximicrobium wynnwilliamsii]